MRITPQEITDLVQGEVFVFGSNESGIHGAGAARLAYDSFGAYVEQGFGPMGQTFAIPTKDWNIHSLSLSVIKNYVDRFIAYASDPQYNTLKFYVTQIGCGLAGFKPEDIAPMFSACIDMENVYLPQEFIDEINKNQLKF